MPVNPDKTTQPQSLVQIRAGISDLMVEIRDYHSVLAVKPPRGINPKSEQARTWADEHPHPKPTRWFNEVGVLGPVQEDLDDPLSSGSDREYDVTTVKSKADAERRKRKVKDSKNSQGALQFRPLMSPEECRYQVVLMNQYWEALTGKNIRFRYYPEQQPYVSPTEQTMIRNKILRSMFTEKPVILEIGVGCGSEFITILFMMNAAKVIGLEPAEADVNGKDAFKVVWRNRKRFFEAFAEYNIPEKVPNELWRETAAEYFARVPRGSHHHLTILDPPFRTKQDESFESDLRQCLEWVMLHVLVPMLEGAHTTDVFVLKSRYPPGRCSIMWKELADQHFKKTHEHSAFMRSLVFYDSQGACPFQKDVDWTAVERGNATRGVFYWVEFSELRRRIHPLHNSELWTTVVRNGQSVYVPKRYFQGPDLTYDYGQFTGNHPVHFEKHGDDELIPGPNKSARPAKDNFSNDAFDEACEKGAFAELEHIRDPTMGDVPPPKMHPDRQEPASKDEEGFQTVRRGRRRPKP